MVPSNGSSFFGNGNPLNGQWFNGNTPTGLPFNGGNIFNGVNGFNGVNNTAGSFNGFGGFNASMPFNGQGLNSACGNPMLATAILASCTPNPAAAFAYATALSNCFSASSTLPGSTLGLNNLNWNGNALTGGFPGNAPAYGTWNTLAGFTSGWNGNANFNNGWNGNANPSNGWNGNGNFSNGWNGNANLSNGWNGNATGMNPTAMNTGVTSPAACSSSSGTYGQWTGTTNRNAFAGTNCSSVGSPNTGNAFSAASVATGNSPSNWGNTGSTESSGRTPARAAA